jgi:hypothetical protein
LPDCDGLKELSQLFSVLRCYGIESWTQFDPTIVRGLSYYTGTVFECFDRKVIQSSGDRHSSARASFVLSVEVGATTHCSPHTPTLQMLPFLRPDLGSVTLSLWSF